MSREIKFRAFHLATSTMHPVWYAIEPGSYDGYALMQYTGLKDRNGKEIYEGDILRDEWHSEGTGLKEVEYGFKNCSCCDGVYGFGGGGDAMRSPKAHEVVGNVYENPELLTEKK